MGHVLCLAIVCKRDVREADRQTNTATTYLNIIHTKNVATVIHILLQVLIKILKHKGEGFLSMYNIMEGHCKQNILYRL